MSVYRPKGSPYYHFDFQVDRRRFHGSTQQTDRRLAEGVERIEKRKAKAAAGATKKPGPVAAAMTADEAIGRYWDEVGQHTATAAETERNLERLLTSIGADTPVAAITDDVLSRLVARRRGEYRRGQKKLGLVSAGQVNRTVTQLLRRVLTRARKTWKQALPEEPDWAAHMLDEPRERVRELTYAEEERLEDVERGDYRPARLFAQITGLRRREVVGLTWPQVDFDAEVIRVVGKGDEPHVLPITPDLHGLLWPLRGHHPMQVFTYVCRRGGREPRSGKALIQGERYPITYWGLGSAMKRALRQAGVADFRVHDLRHTAATRTLRATGNLRIAQKLLGHSSPRTTAKYAHATLDDVREAMSRTASENERRRAKSRNKSRSAAPAGES